MGRFFARFADGLAPAAREPLGLWWSSGSERMAPSVMMSRGLPPANAFRELLGGGAQNTAPSRAAAAVDLALPSAPAPAGATLAELVLPPEFASARQDETALPSPGTGATPIDVASLVDLALPPPAAGATHLDIATQLDIATLVDLALPPAASSLHWRSAAISDAGRVRDENQDAFVERADAGLWLVADGMGGHQGGRMASTLIAERVNGVAAPGDAAALGDATALARDVAAAISAANAELRRRGETQPGFDGGSTVVALCARGDEGVALWAGDSRLYRLRGGELERLTRDHSVAEEDDGAPGEEAHMLTRAVGGADLLTLEERRVDLRPDDRLLLCSDGLYGDLTPPEIAARLALPDSEAAARGLLALALERGGADNATAVVIEVSRATPGP
jgi:serine/threonine protein phosphatase PrpC